MNQITEDYVSFEIAVLLKEKGFNGECIAYFSLYKDNNTSIHRWRNRQTYVNIKNNGYTIVPTHQMALKWLREVHRIEVNVVLSELSIDNIRKYMFDIYSSDRNNDFNSIQKDGFDSHEETVEAAILYVLKNLI